MVHRFRLVTLAKALLAISVVASYGCAGSNAASNDCAGATGTPASGTTGSATNTSVGASGASGVADGGASNPTSGTDGGAAGSDGGSTAFPAGRGATVPWVEMQAEDAMTNAKVLGPSRTKWDATHIEAEAIGRKAVELDKTGDYVEFTTTAPTNSIVVRFSIPDAPGGGGISATLGLYVNGTRVTSLPLTSHYSWSYLGGLIGSASTDTPGPQPHTFFDEVHYGPADSPAIGEIPVGAKVRLQRDAQDTANFYVVDLVDFEEVAPALTMPAGFTSITDFGVMPNDGKDHADDILKALASTPKLWFPPGEYLAEQFTGGNVNNVGLDNHGTEVRGAGMWYTTLRGKKAIFFCDGASTVCNYSDFAIFGEATARDEETVGVQKAFAGPMGNGSTLANLWIEHEVGAIWVGNDPPYQDAPTQNLHIHDVRIRDTYADGINLDNGTSNSLIENCTMRNTGDDAAVVWSIQWTKWVKDMTYSQGPNYIDPAAVNAPDQGIGHGNTFRHISVQMPWRANCFAAYGGYNNTWEDSTCEDVLTYPGILIDNEFSSYPFGSENVPAPPANEVLTTFQNISLVRAGGEMFEENTPNPWQHGAVKLYMREGDVNDVLVQNVDVVDPTYGGIEFRGFGTAYVPAGEKYEPGLLAAADAAKYTNITFKNVNVTNAGTYGIEVLDGAGRGSASFDTVNVSGSTMGALQTGNATSSFFLKVGSGNAGW